jgi:hypothetical protein
LSFCVLPDPGAAKQNVQFVDINDADTAGKAKKPGTSAFFDAVQLIS